jgi:putative spermidine/putrescine transport system permease protein
MGRLDTQVGSVAPTAPRPILGPAVANGVWFVPFVAFALLFLVLPSVGLVVGSVTGPHGGFTLSYLGQLFQQQYLDAYATSVEISVITSVLGGLFGVLLSWAVVAGGVPQITRSILLTFSGVASNFAGIPLAFAFVSTLGPVGMVTLFLSQHFGINIYQDGFSLFSIWGLAITYLYFQIPLMVLLITPALDNITRWQEAAANLGASSWQYWWRVGLPILRSPLLGATLLLFGGGFGAYATAYALTSGMINLVPILIGQELSGNVLYSPALGDALAVGMIIIMSAVFAGFLLLQRGQTTSR